MVMEFCAREDGIRKQTYQWREVARDESIVWKQKMGTEARLVQRGASIANETKRRKNCNAILVLNLNVLFTIIIRRKCSFHLWIVHPSEFVDRAFDYENQMLRDSEYTHRGNSCKCISNALPPILKLSILPALFFSVDSIWIQFGAFFKFDNIIKVNYQKNAA